jgi:ABC-type phosphate/phosphonate transport system substrate-binding protein
MKRRLVLSAALLWIVLAWACAGSSPSSAVKAFYGAIGDGKTDDAIGLLSQQTIKTLGKEKLQTGIQEASQ